MRFCLRHGNRFGEGYFPALLERGQPLVGQLQHAEFPGRLPQVPEPDQFPPDRRPFRPAVFAADAVGRELLVVPLANLLRAELQTDYATAQTAKEELESLDLSVADAAESLRLTELRYQNGEALVLEVADAQSTYVTAENAREDGYVRYQNALAALQTLTGTM